MKPPGNRYRIEERDRRLVTIDTWTDKPVESGARPQAEQSARWSKVGAPSGAPGAGPRGDILTITDLYQSAITRGRAGLSGRRLITQHWFDPAAYRAVTLTDSMADQLTLWARGSLALPVLLFIVWQIIGWGTIFLVGWGVIQALASETWQQKIGEWLERGEVELL
jgi:hypothetical protein